MDKVELLTLPGNFTHLFPDANPCGIQVGTVREGGSGKMVILNRVRVRRAERFMLKLSIAFRLASGHEGQQIDGLSASAHADI